MTLRQLTNIITLALAFLLLAPAGLILGSWNSLPGDPLYSTKRTLETVALTLASPSYQTQTNLQAKLITRRLDEATITIDKKTSSAGLDELKAQLQAVQTQIQQAPNEAAKAAATQKLVTTLSQTKSQLETKKQILIAVTPTPPPAGGATLEPPEIVAAIEDVQQEINDIITTMMPDSDNRGRSEDHRQDKDKNDDDKDRGKLERQHNRQDD